MLPPRRCDALAPAGRTWRAPEHHACCWQLVVREVCCMCVRRWPAPHACTIVRLCSTALDRERDAHPAADAQRRQPALRIALG
ncbi:MULTISPECIES: hypothetical protein, partial [unclassified Burkholderia]|uniref:hypothetical protein n=1 Tax=unclassified Burkholderia TaxID=2613784 RepID=UPI0021AB3911